MVTHMNVRLFMMAHTLLNRLWYYWTEFGS